MKSLNLSKIFIEFILIEHPFKPYRSIKFNNNTCYFAAYRACKVSSFTSGAGAIFRKARAGLYNPPFVGSALECEGDRPQLDTIQTIDSTGGLVEEIDLVPIILQSNWAGLLAESTDFCDPLHLNYIDVIKAVAGCQDCRETAASSASMSTTIWSLT